MQDTFVFALESPVGWWSVTTMEAAVLSLDYLGESLPAGMRTEASSKLEMRLDCMLSRYFKGDPVDFSPVPVIYPEKPMSVAKVMRILRTIPHGRIHSYQWMAEQMGNIKAVREAGGALGRNPVPIIVPCHRIVAKHNKLGGFMQNQPEGARLKRFLLELEGHRFAGESTLIRPEQAALPLANV